MHELTKTTINNKIKELSMCPDHSLQQEKINILVIDLRNIISTHSQTLSLLYDYPAELPSITFNVIQASDTLL